MYKGLFAVAALAICALGIFANHTGATSQQSEAPVFGDSGAVSRVAFFSSDFDSSTFSTAVVQVAPPRKIESATPKNITCSAGGNGGTCSTTTTAGECSATMNNECSVYRPGDQASCSTLVGGSCSVIAGGGVCSTKSGVGTCSAVNGGTCSVIGNTGQCSAFVSDGKCSVQAGSGGSCSVAEGSQGKCSSFATGAKCSVYSAGEAAAGGSGGMDTCTDTNNDGATSGSVLINY